MPSYPSFLNDSPPQHNYKYLYLMHIYHFSSSVIQIYSTGIYLALSLYYPINPYLVKRWHVKIIIGVTQEPEKIREYVSQHHGDKGTLTEVGPFLTTLDALNWLAYLKSMICDFQELIPTPSRGKESLWYGFTFEQAANPVGISTCHGQLHD